MASYRSTRRTARGPRGPPGRAFFLASNGGKRAIAEMKGVSEDTRDHRHRLRLFLGARLVDVTSSFTELL